MRAPVRAFNYITLSMMMTKVTMVNKLIMMLMTIDIMVLMIIDIMMLMIKMAIYCPQGNGTLRQQLLMMH